MKKLLFSICFLVLFAPSPSRPAALESVPTSPAKNIPFLSKVTSYMLQKDPAHQIWVNSQAVHVSKNGEILSFLLKDKVKVSRDDFFPKFQANLGLGKDQMEQIQVLDVPTEEWVVSRHVQKHKGLEVPDAEYALLEKEGRVASAFGRVAAGLDLDVTPGIDEAKALETALNDIGAETYEWEDQSDPEKENPPKGKLVIVSKDFKFTKESFRLAYRYEITSTKPFWSWTIDVDAKTGEVLNRISNIMTGDVPTEGTTFYNGNRQFTAHEEGGKYRLKRDASPKIETMYTPADPAKMSGDYVSNNGKFTDPEVRPGVSVHWGVQQAIEFYQQYGCVGLDCKGERPIQSYIYDEPIDQEAFYSRHGDFNKFVYGGGSTPAPTVTLDTVGHEFTHAVTSYTSSLLYQGESGALNEAFADIFGLLIAAFASKEKMSWKTSGRDLADPHASTQNGKPYPRPAAYKGLHYKETTGPCTRENDFCGVHDNSTVAGHWFYLLVTGGKGFKGIDLQEASEIAYLTMILLSKTADFPGARGVSEWVAGLKFGFQSPQRLAVAQAWHSVNVGGPPGVNRSFVPPTGAIGVEPWSPATTLSWSILPDETEWQVEIATDPNFSHKVVQGIVTSVYQSGSGQVAILSGKQVSEGPMMTGTYSYLDAGTSYYWRVRASKKLDSFAESTVADAVSRISFFGTSPAIEIQKMPPYALQREAVPDEYGEYGEHEDWSQVLYFKTKEKRSALIAPKSGASDVNPWHLVFQYGAVSGAQDYEVRVIEGSQNGTKVLPSGISHQWTQTFKLKQNTDYQWDVLPLGPKDDKGRVTKGNWSKDDPTPFKTGIPTTSLIYPPNGASVGPWGLELSWNPVKGAEKYEVLVSKNSDLSDPFFDSGEITGTKTVVSLPKQDATYYWGVVPRDLDANEWGKTEKRSFTVELQKSKASFWPHEAVAFKSSPVTFKWTKVTGAQDYKLIFNKKGGGPPIVTVVTGTPCEGDKICETINSTSFSEDKIGYCATVTARGPEAVDGIPSDPMCYPISPPFPTLLTPAYYQQNAVYPTPVTWKCDFCKEYGTDSYVVHWKNDNVESTHGVIGATGWTLPTGANAGSGYLWWVCAFKNNMTTCTGPSIFWTKAAPQQQQQQQQQSSGSVSAPSLICPLGYWANGGFGDYFVSTPTYKFKWSKVSGATSYQLTLYTASGAGYEVLTQVLQQDYGDTGESQPIWVSPQVAYRWGIKARQGNGPWSSQTLSEYFTAVYGPGHPKAVFTKCAP